jgi:hypothetical protein
MSGGQASAAATTSEMRLEKFLSAPITMILRGRTDSAAKEQYSTNNTAANVIFVMIGE